MGKKLMFNKKDIIKEDILLDGVDVFATISCALTIEHRGDAFDSFKRSYDFISIKENFYEPVLGMSDCKVITTNMDITVHNDFVNAPVINEYTIVFKNDTAIININLSEIDEMIHSVFNSIILIKLKSNTFVVIY